MRARKAACTASKKLSSKSSIDLIPVLMFSGIVIKMVLLFQSSSHGSMRTSVPHFSSGKSRPGFRFTMA